MHSGNRSITTSPNSSRRKSFHAFLPLINQAGKGRLSLPRLDLTNTLHGLEGSSVTCPLVDTALIGTYVKYFVKSGSGGTSPRSSAHIRTSRISGSANHPMLEQAGSKTDGSAGFVCPQTKPGAANPPVSLSVRRGRSCLVCQMVRPDFRIHWKHGWLITRAGDRGIMKRRSSRLLPLVENLSHSIRPLMDKPFAFFGHSHRRPGCYLNSHDICVKRICPSLPPSFISACRAPHIPDPHPPIQVYPMLNF